MDSFNYQEWMLEVFSEAMETFYFLAAPTRLFRLFYRGRWNRIHPRPVGVN